MWRFSNQTRCEEERTQYCLSNSQAFFTGIMAHCQKYCYLDHRKCLFLSLIFDTVNVRYHNVFYLNNEKNLKATNHLLDSLIQNIYLYIICDGFCILKMYFIRTGASFLGTNVFHICQNRTEQKVATYHGLQA